MLEAALVLAFLDATVRAAVPLALGALGELVSERSGVINIGLEGSMIAGALGGALGALSFQSPWLGVAVGGLAGMGVASVFAVFVVALNTDQIITGTAVTLGGLGFTAVVYQARFGATGTLLTLPTLQAVPIPLLSELPFVGGVMFNQPGTTYLAYLLVPAVWLFLYRTEWGLELRAVGESPAAAREAGVRVSRVRWWSTLFGGLLAGLAGAHLALAYTGTFQANMTDGRGFIAIAVVVLGRWDPIGVFLAALFFGAASALPFQMQASNPDVPYQLFLALPYALALLALAGWVGRARAPAALALPWPREGDSH